MKAGDIFTERKQKIAEELKAVAASKAKQKAISALTAKKDVGGRKRKLKRKTRKIKRKH